MATTKQPKHYTVAGAADYLQCSENHVRKLVDAGKLMASDIAPPGAKRRQLRIHSDALEFYLLACQVFSEECKRKPRSRVEQPTGQWV